MVKGTQRCTWVVTDVCTSGAVKARERHVIDRGVGVVQSMGNTYKGSIKGERKGEEGQVR